MRPKFKITWFMLLNMTYFDPGAIGGGEFFAHTHYAAYVFHLINSSSHKIISEYKSCAKFLLH